MRNRWLKFALVGSLLSLFACDCGEEPTGVVPPDPCSGGTLENRVAAAPWASPAAGITAYRYQAALDATELAVALLDERDEVIDILRVAQLFGDASEPDGTMRAALDGGELVLTTRGSALAPDGWFVHARIDGPGAALWIDARVEDLRCAADVDDRPPCVGAVPVTSDPLYAVPSCGLPLDAALAAGRAPEVVALRYRALARDGMGPAVGGSLVDSRGRFFVLDVLQDGALADRDSVAAWAEATGLSAHLASVEARRLLLSYLDPSWRRGLALHAAHCFDEGSLVVEQALSAAEPSQRRQATTSGSNTNRNSSAWGSGGGGAAKKKGGSSWGDPHLTTMDGHAFDLQAKGEFVLARSLDEAAPLEVQARFEALTRAGAPPACANVTWTTAVGALVGERVFTARGRDADVPAFTLDGVPLDPVALPALPDGMQLEVTRRSLRVITNDGVRLTIENAASSLRVELDPGQAHPGEWQGLFGDADGDPWNDHRLPDGVVLAPPLSAASLYDVLADAWRVEQASSLLPYASGESTDSFTDSDFPTAPTTAADLDAAARAAAEATCRARSVEDPARLDACALDVACDSDTAANAADVAPPALVSDPALEAPLVSGDARVVPAPAEVDPAAPFDGAAGGQCLAPAARRVQVMRERSTTLASELEVDIIGPGVFGGPIAPTTGAIAAGTAVESWLLHAPAEPRLAATLSGSLRFGRRVLGVVWSAGGLDDTDALLGAAGTSYRQTPSRGVNASTGLVTWHDDGLGIDVQLTAVDDAEQLRVLVEVLP